MPDSLIDGGWGMRPFNWLALGATTVSEGEGGKERLVLLFFFKC